MDIFFQQTINCMYYESIFNVSSSKLLDKIFPVQ